ncbi:unnamed protein product [Closterium sp. NIES-65]|nr:unnamed protein product [Closterium sp. NIES-65]
MTPAGLLVPEFPIPGSSRCYFLPSPPLPPPFASTSPSRCLHFPLPSPPLPPPIASTSPSLRLHFPLPSPPLPPPVASTSPSPRLHFPLPSPSLPPPVDFTSLSHRPRSPLPSPCSFSRRPLFSGSPCFPCSFSSLRPPLSVSPAYSLPPLPPNPPPTLPQVVVAGALAPSVSVGQQHHRRLCRAAPRLPRLLSANLACTALSHHPSIPPSPPCTSPTAPSLPLAALSPPPPPLLTPPPLPPPPSLVPYSPG